MKKNIYQIWTGLQTTLSTDDIIFVALNKYGPIDELQHDLLSNFK